MLSQKKIEQEWEAKLTFSRSQPSQGMSQNFQEYQVRRNGSRIKGGIKLKKRIFILKFGIKYKKKFKEGLFATILQKFGKVRLLTASWRLIKFQQLRVNKWNNGYSNLS